MPDTNTLSVSLYEEDFFLWTQAQAAALRARRPDAMDWDALAEEIEDLGKRELREASSFTARIIEHLFKLAWSRNAEPKDGWRAEIVQFRRELGLALTRAIRTRIEGDLERLHRSAARAAELQFRAREPDAPRDPTLRWTLPQILGEGPDDPAADG